MLGKQKTGKLKPWFKEKGEGGRPFNRGQYTFAVFSFRLEEKFE